MAARTRVTPDPNDQYDDQDQDFDQDISGGRKSRKRTVIIPIVLVLVLVGGLTAILGFNVFNIRDQYIMPPLRNIPFVGNFIPEAAGFKYVYEYQYIDGEYVEVAVAVAVEPELAPAAIPEDVIALMEELEATRIALAQAQALNEQYAESVLVLQTYRDFITHYREQRQLFDEMVAMGDPDAFAAFYEEVDPDNAARLFTLIRARREVDREFRRFAATYAEMNTDEAASLFSLLLASNSELLINILLTFNTAQRAAIFNEMDSADVAVITILMEPYTDVMDVLPPVPLIDGTAMQVPLITLADTQDD